MKSIYARGVVLSLGLICLANAAQAQNYLGTPSLLPMPAAAQGYPAQQVAYDNLWNDPPTAPNPGVSPSDLPSPPPDGSVITEDYKGAMTGDWGAGSGAVCGNGGCCCTNNWFVYAGGLFMWRANQSEANVSFDTAGPNTVLCTCMTNTNLIGGFEVTGGRSFNCGNNALALTYWGLYPGTQTANAYAGIDTVGNLNAIADFSNLSYDDGTGAQSAANFFDNAVHHQIFQSSTIQNVEVNLFGGCCGGNNLWNCGCNNCCGRRLTCNWLAGIRYFQFNENFSLASDNADTVFDGSLNEMYYDVRTTNSLLGFQVGGGLNYCLNSSWSLYGTGRAGIYGNQQTSTQAIYGANGNAMITGGAYAGSQCAAYASRNALAMIGQLDMGAKWNINCRWSAFFGYRIMGVTGVATTADQIQSDVSNLGAMQQVNGNSSLLLHGGYGGLQFCF
jgi:hypothetical protein